MGFFSTSALNIQPDTDLQAPELVLHTIYTINGMNVRTFFPITTEANDPNGALHPSVRQVATNPVVLDVARKCIWFNNQIKLMLLKSVSANEIYIEERGTSLSKFKKYLKVFK